MNLTILNILFKLFVREFYRTNAPLFLLIIGLAGGFMRDVDHLALAEFIVGTPVLFLIPLFIWFVYALKIHSFNFNVVRGTENEFVLNLNLFPIRERWWLLLAITIGQLTPVYAYAFFLIRVAFEHNSANAMGLIVLTVGLLTVSLTHKTNQLIALGHTEKKVWRLKHKLDSKFTKSYPTIVIEWIIRIQGGVFIGFKIFSMAILFAILKLYQVDPYDLRLLGMGVTISFCFTYPVLIIIHRLNNYHFCIIRQLPFSLLQRVVKLSISLIIIMLPEIGLLCTDFPAHFSVYHNVECLFYGMSIPLVLYSCLYTRNIRREQFTVIVFFISMALIVLILFQLPLILLGTLNYCTAFYFYNKFYYKFEYT